MMILYKSLLEHGYSVAFGVLYVAVFSGWIHGLVGSVTVGWRCLVLYLMVGLAYSASQSVLLPMLIHALW